MYQKTICLKSVPKNHLYKSVPKIHLYKEKTVVRKNVPESEAVEALIELIKENGDWQSPKV